MSVLAKNWSSNFFLHTLFSLNSLNKFYKIQINSLKIRRNSGKNQKIQTVGGREHSDLTDNIVLTPLRISRGFKLGQRPR